MSSTTRFRDPLRPLLDRRGVVVLDGGLATEIERRGVALDPVLWSAGALLDAPKVVEEVHLDYFRAGADVAITASYQASPEGFRERGLSRADAIGAIRSSVRIARRARDRFLEESGGGDRGPGPLVAGSVGCYGAVLHDGSEYRGRYGRTLEELVAFHRPRVEALLEAGADLLACETVPCRIEAEALVRLLEQYPEAPFWLSFSCRDGARVHEGRPLRECFEAAAGCGQAVALGLNCTAPDLVEDLLRSVQGAAAAPLVVYPNSGETWDSRRRRWSGGTGERFGAGRIEAWRDLGARLIGGCCRTTPATIREIAGVLRSKGTG